VGAFENLQGRMGAQGRDGIRPVHMRTFKLLARTWNVPFERTTH
jgi:hypothetical protein